MTAVPRPTPGKLSNPHAGLTAERSVLGALLMEPDEVWRVVEPMLVPDDFSSADHRQIYVAIGALMRSGSSVDVTTVFTQLASTGESESAGGLAHLNRLSQCVATTRNVGAHAAIVREIAAERRLLEIAQAPGPIAPKLQRVARLADQVSELANTRSESLRLVHEILNPDNTDRAAPEYPVDALGPLAPACLAISRSGQVQPAMVGQCLLGAASLLTQGLFNAETLTGSRPLSLYLLTLGDSGDGKSIAQGVALDPVHRWQREAGDRHRLALADFEQAQRSSRKKIDPLPLPPVSPYRLSRDATVEGLRRDLDGGFCSQGVFTDEAAAILSGYGMSAEHRSKTAGVFSGLWDNGHLSVSRGVAGRIERYGRRVALHWLIQPMAARNAVGDPMLTALGFWPRFLVAWPSPLQPRRALPFSPTTDAAITEYWKRCIQLLAEPLPEDASHCPLLPLHADARELIGRAFERFEFLGRRGRLRVIKPFALRAAEQACRVAGVLSAFEGCSTIGRPAAKNALTLMTYSLDTWLALVTGEEGDRTAANAYRLYAWLSGRPNLSERAAHILRLGPTRNKHDRDAALELLMAHRLVEIENDMVRALAPEQGAT